MSGAVQVPQSSVPPQPSGMLPQSVPCAAHVVGVQHTFGVPPPPQTAGAGQVPQFKVPPQLSGMPPQLAPCAAHVVRVQPHTFAVPPPPQMLGDAHEPQSSGLGQVPLGIVPQLAPFAVHVVGVQHTPNVCEPGGPPLTQTPLLQL